MNATRTVRKSVVIRISVLFAAAVLTAGTSSAIGCPVSKSPHPFDTILVQKQTTSKKHKIRIYPNADDDVLFFSARGLAGKVYQLFLFDLEGNLVQQVNIKNRQTTVVNNIGKGNYLFEVFSNDERIETGQVIIK